jgi:hypothetical protein
METQTQIPEAELLAEIESVLALTGTAPTMFGKRLGDPNLIKTIAAGRELRRGTMARIRLLLQDLLSEHESCKADISPDPQT